MRMNHNWSMLVTEISFDLLVIALDSAQEMDCPFLTNDIQERGFEEELPF